MAKPKAEIIKHPIERIGSDVKKSAWSSAAESLITMILGILFIIWPDTMMQAVAYIIGGFLIIRGAYNIMVYFMDNNVYSNLLLSGVVSTLVGIVALVMGPNIANVFRIVVGVFLIYESLVHLNNAIKLHHAGVNLWRVVTVFALVILVLGIFVVFNETAAVIGWAMVIAGLIGVAGDLMFINQVDRVVEYLTKPLSKK